MRFCPPSVHDVSFSVADTTSVCREKPEKNLMPSFVSNCEIAAAKDTMFLKIFVDHYSSLAQLVTGDAAIRHKEVERNIIER